ncbi:MAG: hypothetical protein MUC48_21145 [Leptolyngbya sp. Prado105]|jgi:hypothetical protein|nr:hypothetical protein [Leptolyngbya sp. Prado105]
MESKKLAESLMPQGCKEFEKFFTGETRKREVQQVHSVSETEQVNWLGSPKRNNSD